MVTGYHLGLTSGCSWNWVRIVSWFHTVGSAGRGYTEMGPRKFWAGSGDGVGWDRKERIDRVLTSIVWVEGHWHLAKQARNTQWNVIRRAKTRKSAFTVPQNNMVLWLYVAVTWWWQWRKWLEQLKMSSVLTSSMVVSKAQSFLFIMCSRVQKTQYSQTRTRQLLNLLRLDAGECLKQPRSIFWHRRYMIHLTRKLQS